MASTAGERKRRSSSSASSPVATRQRGSPPAATDAEEPDENSKGVSAVSDSVAEVSKENDAPKTDVVAVTTTDTNSSTNKPRPLLLEALPALEAFVQQLTAEMSATTTQHERNHQATLDDLEQHLTKVREHESRLREHMRSTSQGIRSVLLGGAVAADAR